MEFSRQTGLVSHPRASRRIGRHCPAAACLPRFNRFAPSV